MSVDPDPTESPCSVREPINRVRRTLHSVLIGQETLADRLLIGLLTGGHLLLEGVPGLAKTLAVRCLAQATGLAFGRVQFTPDLLPSDLTGTEVFHPATGKFTVRKGPVFANILLADEINRAPAKVQSALLEAMQERRITLGTETFPLPDPFLVLATQNPVEHEGTYPLPEAQVDRFLLKTLVSYPTRDEERQILSKMGVTTPIVDVSPCMTASELASLRTAVDAVHLEERILEFILDLTRATRDPQEFGLDCGRWIELGASPRAGIAMILASKAYALLHGRDFVLPEDVKSIAPDALRHRLTLSFEAEAEDVTPERIIADLLAKLPVP